MPTFTALQNSILSDTLRAKAVKGRGITVNELIGVRLSEKPVTPIGVKRTVTRLAKADLLIVEGDEIKLTKDGEACRKSQGAEGTFSARLRG